jgi:hypothetical protein
MNNITIQITEKLKDDHRGSFIGSTSIQKSIPENYTNANIENAAKEALSELIADHNKEKGTEHTYAELFPLGAEVTIMQNLNTSNWFIDENEHISPSN